ncbi:MAG: DNA-deoxyinosine glycosylase [Eubacteriales bacterium]|jgi:hypoxanthine-DNA glycosylase
MTPSEKVVHPIPALYDRDSRILILGSFPSVKSREQQFFYAHPQNRFWKVLAGITGSAVPETVEEKKNFLHASHIALWDTIHSCTITGSSDSSIRDVVPNDLTPVLEAADIRAIFCNGGTSYRLYGKYLEPATGRRAVKLPSTSPANAAWRLDRLKEAWKVILLYLQDGPAA